MKPESTRKGTDAARFKPEMEKGKDDSTCPHSEPSPVSTASWRDSGSVTKPRESRGIAPSSFHNSSSRHEHKNLPPRNSSGFRRPRKVKTPSSLLMVFNDASQSVVRQQRREVTTKQKLQRAAYKEVTSLKTWPLQDMAIKDLDRLLRVYFGKEEIDLDEEKVEQAEKEHGDSTGLSSSSLDEPKRSRSLPKNKEDESMLSPRKSTLRHQFKMDFLREQSLQGAVAAASLLHEPVGCNNDNSSHLDDFPTKNNNQLVSPALWCMEPRMFSIEKSATGKRKYLVGHLGRFLDLYWRKCDPKNRHYYELIREKTPCRLYFDLEFSKPANPHISDNDCEVLMTEFINELVSEIQSVYYDNSNNTNIAMDRTCVVDLDSSTDKKFSRHLIVHLPNKALFTDAPAAGRFVRAFVGRLAEQIATGELGKKQPTLNKYLFINTAPPTKVTLQDKSGNGRPSSVVLEDDGDCSSLPNNTNGDDPTANKTCFVDLGVYTRNRLFRLLGSAKFGKPASAALRIAPANTFPFPEGFGNNNFYTPDIEKGMQPSESSFDKEQSRPKNDDHTNNQLDEDMEKFLSAVDWTVHAEALADTLVVPANCSKLNCPILPEASVISESSNDKKKTSKNLRPPSSVCSTSREYPASMSGTENSPFPPLDKLILNSLGKRGGVPGAIRAWSVDYETNASQETIANNDKGIHHDLPRAITYQMCRNRWCERIGRPHKSNNIMWSVDLRSMTCAQTCHDPECKLMRFRGKPLELPESVKEAVADALFEWQLGIMDESVLLQKKKNTSYELEFDDAEFEKALLALDISDKKLIEIKKNIPVYDSDSSEDLVKLSKQLAARKKQQTGQISPSSGGALMKPSTTDILIPVTTTATHKQSIHSRCEGDENCDNILSDTALFDAALSNPELFP